MEYPTESPSSQHNEGTCDALRTQGGQEADCWNSEMRVQSQLSENVLTRPSGLRFPQRDAPTARSMKNAQILLKNRVCIRLRKLLETTLQVHL